MTQDYYGTKKVTAWRQDTTAISGAVQEGYGLKYEDGYQSWSPKEVFDKAYQPMNALSFGHALEVLKAGGRVARAGWNGKNMYLQYIPNSVWGTLTGYGLPDMDSRFPWIGMKTANNQFGPWLASQTDVLADDWQVVE